MLVSRLFSIFPIIGLFLSGCNSWSGSNLFEQNDKFEILRTYDNNFGSRIEVFLELAEKELVDNFKEKKYLMIRENQPRSVLHPRKDYTLRQLILSAHEDENITDQEKLAYLKKCDHLFELWEKHWATADKKAKRLGFDR